MNSVDSVVDYSKITYSRSFFTCSRSCMLFWRSIFRVFTSSLRPVKTSRKKKKKVKYQSKTGHHIPLTGYSVGQVTKICFRKLMLKDICAIINPTWFNYCSTVGES